jgi:hypothetical protein
MKNIKYTFMFLLSLLAMSSCSIDDIHIPYDLRLSNSSYVFPVNGGELKVTVDNTFTEGWDASFDEANEWLTETGRTEKSITFTAAPNAAGATIAPVKVTFTAGEVTRELTLSQDSGIAGQSYFAVPDGIYAISHNGRYLVTVNTNAAKDGLIDEICVIDTETDEETLATKLEGMLGGINCISDDGKTIVYNMNYGGIYEWMILKDGQPVEPTVPEGGREAQIHAMIPDASIMVGSVIIDGKTEPVKWTNGVPALLPRPEFQRAKPENASNGAKAMAINSDGTFILGNNGGFGVEEAFFWDANGDWQWLGPITSEEKPGIFGPTTIYFYASGNGGSISNNDKYMSMHYQAWGQGILGEGKVSVPALYNIESGEFEYIANDVIADSPTGGINVSATDDGGLFYFTNDTARTAYYWQGGSAQLSQQYIESLTGGMYVGTNVQIQKIIADPLLIIGSFQTLTYNQVSFYVKSPNK